MNKSITVPKRTEQNTVCFTGHRFLSANEIPQIQRMLHDVIRDCYRRLDSRWFVCGGALGFDTLAAQEVLDAKEEFPDIGLCIAAPCPEQSSRWKESEKRVYQQIWESADEKIILAQRYFSGCMHIRNQFMVQHSSVCICWLRNFTGGTGYTVRYALSLQRRVINLCMPEHTVDPHQIKEPIWNCIFTFPSVCENAHIVHSIHMPAVIPEKWKNTYLRFSGKRSRSHPF